MCRCTHTYEPTWGLENVGHEDGVDDFGGILEAIEFAGRFQIFVLALKQEDVFSLFHFGMAAVRRRREDVA